MDSAFLAAARPSGATEVPLGLAAAGGCRPAGEEALGRQWRGADEGPPAAGRGGGAWILPGGAACAAAMLGQQGRAKRRAAAAAVPMILRRPGAGGGTFGGRPVKAGARVAVAAGASEQATETGVAREKQGLTWKDVAGCDVCMASAPKLVVHFCGGAFASASPKFLYRHFIELLAAEAGAVVIATPYKTGFDHDGAAAEAVVKFDLALGDLEFQGLEKGLPVLGVGHSLGGLVMTLLAARPQPLDRLRLGCVVISFNQRPLTDAIPITLPPPPPEGTEEIAKFFSDSFIEALRQERLQEGLDLVSQVAGSVLESSGRGEGSRFDLGPRTAGLLAQVGPILGDLALGKRGFSPNKAEIASRIKASFSSPRTLLVQFANDGIDETPWLNGALAR
eukprot:CAMPEP_0203925876 /NCGR_PEP_ID=MMETSP0359-20131031/65464_1 /ASSEMBLY_ACC=CAM_ASM_000338 /TAXON_ID=268821 /ORGANISM="Scrippsiella Hangoei, Strain SHTV-5" /LENGTH=392 /DNA_ID=CAMNT_0050854369 /DNA_START=74 /DNA_END=1248 /DNA_ORIENTATION=-